METRPGVTTTEFWVTMFTNILGIVQMVAGPVNVTDNKVAVVLGIINGSYAASRGLAKAGQPTGPTVIPADQGDAGEAGGQVPPQ